MSIVGRTYLERGEPVEVLAQWRHRPVPDTSTSDFQFVLKDLGRRKTGPRNVLIRRASGELVIRPFRGLRRPS